MRICCFKTGSNICNYRGDFDGEAIQKVRDDSKLLYSL